MATDELTLLEALPPYIEDASSKTPFFLTLAKDINGLWSILYMEFEGGTALENLALNDAVTIKEAVMRMEAALRRFNQRRA